MMPKLKGRTKLLALIAVFCIPAAIGIFCFLYALPQKDTIQVGMLPAEFKIDGDRNDIDFQEDNACSAYAAAFVMRHMGTQIEGAELYGEIHRIFGFVPAHEIVRLFQNHGYTARAYHGDMDTLKQRLLNGVPVIVFVSIPGDTHYVAVVGYDEDFVYLADSIPDPAGTDGGWYNRKLSIGEFEQIWKTDIYPVDHIYITAAP